MLLIPCPYCGKRPEIEFTHGGEAHLTRAAKPAEVDDEAWADFLYMRANTKGVYAERWRHAHGCGRFFNALRDTTTDHFLATYKAGEPQPVFPGAVRSPASVPGAGAAVAEAAPDPALRPRMASGAAATPAADSVPGMAEVLGAGAAQGAAAPGATAVPGTEAATGPGAAPGGVAGTPR